MCRLEAHQQKRQKRFFHGSASGMIAASSVEIPHIL
jgi:hypothetical protein